MTRRTLRVVAAGTLAVLGACRFGPVQIPAPQQIPVPPAAEVEQVLFLVGDPGEARIETSPLLQRLQQDIEWWAERVPGDSAVNLLYLGDIVYPLGMHPPGSPEFPQDSAIVASQVQMVAGPSARGRHAQAYFMAGNHDWGLETEWTGYVRLNNLDEFLERARDQTGANARLVPEAGQGGPFVVDLGAHVRLLILDTAWWILAGGRLSGANQGAVLQRIEAAIRDSGDRQVIIAAHHPFQSGGPHGGEFSFWRSLGVRYLLARSGAILQDLTSLPYRDLKRGLRVIFQRTKTPVLFAGGHEHSLQIIEGRHPDDPTWSIVSGSASKVSSLGSEKNLRYGRSAPGYMRLLVHRDGGMSLYVESTPTQFKECPAGPRLRECMAAGVAAFRTVHSQRLR